MVIALKRSVEASNYIESYAKREEVQSRLWEIYRRVLCEGTLDPAERKEFTDLASFLPKENASDSNIQKDLDNAWWLIREITAIVNLDGDQKNIERAAAGLVSKKEATTGKLSRSNTECRDILRRAISQQALLETHAAREEALLKPLEWIRIGYAAGVQSYFPGLVQEFKELEQLALELQTLANKHPLLEGDGSNALLREDLREAATAIKAIKDLQSVSAQEEVRKPTLLKPTCSITSNIRNICERFFLWIVFLVSSFLYPSVFKSWALPVSDSRRL